MRLLINRAAVSFLFGITLGVESKSRRGNFFDADFIAINEAEKKYSATKNLPNNKRNSTSSVRGGYVLDLF